MRIKEVCKRSDLTERTIRFYIEKGLLETKSQMINGRINRDFTEEDVDILKDISKLRKAGFSIPDILDMQNGNRKVQDIVLQHYNQLQSEYALRECLINDLKEIQSRGDISWRKCASLLFREKESNPQNTICYPLDGMEFKETVHIDNQRRKKRKVTWIIIILLLLSMTGIMIYNKYKSLNHNESFVIGEVVINNKWYDEKEQQYYLSIYSTSSSVGCEQYFKSPRTLKIEDEILYNSLLIESKPYASFNIWIEIPPEDTLAYEWTNNTAEFIIQKVLENPEFIKKYCVVKQIQAE
ncbi:MAG: MerR family transcriptional regulator [Lachnospiraceae bacterium]|nr:MerR family transcriptional regulator [Lachnospiraceae bacterium]